MKIQNKTTKELLANNTTKVMGRQTHASLNKMRNKLAKNGASTKKTYTNSLKEKNWICAGNNDSHGILEDINCTGLRLGIYE